MISKDYILRMVKEYKISSGEGARILKMLTQGRKIEEKDITQLLLYSCEYEKKELHYQNQEHEESIVIFDEDSMLKKTLQKLNSFSNSNMMLVNLGEKESLDNFFLELRQKKIELSCIIFNIKSEKFGVLSGVSGYAALEKGLLSVFEITKALFMSGLDRNVRIFFLYESSGLGSAPLFSGMQGFFKTACLENQKVAYKTIGLEPFNPEKIGKILEEEIQLDIYNEDVCYVGDKRYVKSIKPIEREKILKNSVLKSGGTYLLIGGNGGIGFAIAKFLAEKYKANLVISGRRERSQSIQDKVTELVQLGAQVEYVRADITQKESATLLVQLAKRRFGNINGVFQIAGVIKDNYIMKKSKSEWKEVISPKVMGTLHIHEALIDEKIDFLLLFSSIVSVVGNNGQCDYAYANSFLDEFAFYREQLRKAGRCQGKTISINWPLWKDGGMKVPKEVEKYFKSTLGMVSIENDMGIRVLEDILNMESVQTVAVTGFREKLNKRLGMISKGKEKEGEKKEQIGETDFLNEIHCFVKSTIGTILKVEIADVDVEGAFSEYGFESITYTELANLVNEEYDIDLNPTIFFEYPVIKGFAQYIVDNYREKMKKNFRTKLMGIRELGNSAVSEEVFSSFIKKVVVQILKVREEDIDMEGTFNEYGFESITYTELVNRINEEYAIDLNPTVFFEYPVIGDFVKHLLNHFELEMKGFSRSEMVKDDYKDNGWTKEGALEEQIVIVDEVVKEKEETILVDEVVKEKEESVHMICKGEREPVAIIGISGKMPGSNSLEEFWKHIERGEDLVQEIPAERWNWKEYYGDKHEANKSYSKWGGFIPDIDKFDASFFHISAHEASLMDPQHRMLLQTVWEAVEDAGYKASCFAGTNTGVFVGIGVNDYGDLMYQNNVDIEAHTSTGNYVSAAANRISYVFDLHGPSEPVDTACSSSLVAIHRAVENIQNHNCDMAIAGGVNALLSPKAYISFSKAGMLSPDGKCKTFDKNANGYVRSEGVGIVILKPLSQAERDGDTIYGVIKGSFVNHGGKAESYTAPNSHMQSELIVEACNRAGISPDTITYMEAHGTGTKLGDPIEFSGLKKAFDILHQKWNIDNVMHYCGIGSVKTNIGHLEMAAGMAGLFKVLLSMKYKKIPKMLHFKEVNPYVCTEGTPFYFVTETKEWKHLRRNDNQIIPYRAGISSFGFGGVNAHLIVEEYIREKQEIPMSIPALFLFSAKTIPVLKENIKAMIAFLSEERTISIYDMAYTLQTGREEMEERFAVISNSKEELLIQLKAFLAEPKAVNILRRKEKLKQSGAETSPNAHIIDQLIEKMQLEELRNLWLCGYKINWELLYEQKPHRVSLPTYSFDKKRHWIPCNRFTRNQRYSSKNGLFDEFVISKSMKSGLMFKKNFSSTDFQVKHASINNKSCISLSVLLEMLCNQIAIIDPEKRLIIKNIEADEPLVFDENEIDLYLYLTEKEESRYVFTFSDSAEEGKVYAKGEFHFEGNRDIEQLETIVLDEIKERCFNRLDENQIYEKLEHFNLRYDSYLKSIHTVFINEQEGIAEITLSDWVCGELKGCFIHSVVMEAVLQSLPMIWEEGSLRIPKGVQQVDVCHLMDKQSYVYIKKYGQNHYNALVTDSCGTICARFIGISLAHYNEIDPDIYFVPKWYAVPLEKEKQDSIKADENILIVYHGDSQDLKDQLVDRHWNCNVVLADYTYEEEIETKINTVLEKHHYFHRIYYLAGIISERIPFVNKEHIIASQKKGAIGLFGLLKQLKNRKRNLGGLKIKVITNDSVETIEGEVTIPYSASLRGLCKGIAKEYPDISVSCIDILYRDAKKDSKLLKQVAEHFVSEPAHKRNEEVAIRNGLRYQMRISPIRLPVIKEGPFKKRGVYVIFGGAGGIGRELTKYLSVQRKANVVIVGRSTITKELQTFLLGLQEHNGGDVCYVQGDLGDYDSVKRAIVETKQKFGKINGVFHSALALKEKAIEEMTEDEFVIPFDSKVYGSVHLYQALEEEPIDFLMFFSSAQSLAVNHNLSNYAASCNFKDAFAYSLRNCHASFDIKIVNWGFFETIRTKKEFGEKMAVKMLTPKEGIETIEKTLLTIENQVMAFKSDKYFLKSIGVDMESHLELVDFGMKSMLKDKTIETKAIMIDDKNIKEWITGKKELNALCGVILLSAFRKVGVFHGEAQEVNFNEIKKKLHIISLYDRLYFEIITILIQEGYLEKQGDKLVTTSKIYTEKLLELHRWKEEIITNYPQLTAFTNLLWSCAENLLPILKGKVLATEIMFPKSSMSLVEGAYKGNPVADYFNKLVGTAAAEYIRIQREDAKLKGHKIKILEIGAGTGGTSAFVLKQINPYNEHIHYSYTDISFAFVRYGQTEYGTKYSFIDFKVLDIERNVLEQGYQLGEFDIIIAANVLHATKELSRTLTNVKTLLKPNGWLILNELNGNENLLSLTFGLLEGWWLFQDPHLRIKGSPLIEDENWKRTLSGYGFRHTQIYHLHDQINQSIIISEADAELKRTDVAIENRDVNQPERSQENFLPDKAIEPERTNRELDIDKVDYITDVVVKKIAQTLGTAERDIDKNRAFSEMGIDSILGVQMVKAVNEQLKISLSKTCIYDYSSVEALSKHIKNKYGEQISEEKLEQLTMKKSNIVKNENVFRLKQEMEIRHADKVQMEDNDIAIIGMSGKFPQAENAEEFWLNLVNGIDSVTEVPPERWDINQYYDKDKRNLEKTYCRNGAYLQDVDKFDAMFFNISGSEAELMDPQHRLFLEECWKAIEDSGYSDVDMKGRKCGVFVGATDGDYHIKLTNDKVKREPQSFWGNDSAVLAARVSYFLDLKGACIALTTACSSSLVSLHLACQSILSGENEMAIAGGVFVLNTPYYPVLLSNGEMIAEDGRCKTFDDEADGFGLGEGVAAVILKPLRNAIKDHDHIYGVIKASGVNYDGKTNGITAPSSLSQTQLEVEVYKKAGIHPETIDYIETHGTGTKLGDPIEIEALTNAFQEFTEKKEFCAVGSVKTNVGHTAIASGITSIIKVLMMLKYKQIPPSLHFKKENENIHFKESPFYVNAKLRKWERKDHPRRCAVSSFGLGGTNAHVLMEEYIEKKEPLCSLPYYLIPLSVKKEHLILEKLKSVDGWLEANDASLADIAYTLQVGRSDFQYRSCFVVKNLEELKISIKNVISGKISDNYMTEQDSNKTISINNTFSYEWNAEESASVYKSKVIELAKVWLSGKSVEWKRLYGKNLPWRISMPVYPFEDQRYWAGEKKSMSKEQQKHYFKTAWVHKQLDAHSVDVPDDLLLFDTKEDLYHELSKYKKVMLVQQGDYDEKWEEGRFWINPRNSNEMEMLIERLLSRGIRCHTIVYNWNCETFSIQHQYIKESVQNEIVLLFQLIQVIERKMVKSLNLIRLYDGSKISSIANESLLGFFESLNKENLYYNCKGLSIDYVLFQSGRIGELILNELTEKNHRLVKYESGNRMIKQAVELDKISSESIVEKLRIKGTYMITGGAGGIGMIFAKHISEKIEGTVILLGRSELSDSTKNAITELNKRGSIVKYIRCDISSYEEVKDTVQFVRQKYGRIYGVIHSAGVIRDSLLLNKTMHEVQQVLAPKVYGIVNLDEALKDEPLDFFAAFSSMTAITGNYGQSDYAFANGFMDNYISYRKQRKRKGKSLSVNWNLWKDGGMLSNQEMKNLLKKLTGLELLYNDEGLEIFDIALSCASDNLIVMKGAQEDVYRYLNRNQHQNLMEDMAVKREIPNEQLVDYISQDILRHIAKTLKLNEAYLNSKDYMGDYGFDSLSIIKFTEALSSYYSIRVLPSAYYSNSTAVELAVYLYEENRDILKKFYMNEEADSDVKDDSVIIGTKEREVEEIRNSKYKVVEKPFHQPIAIIGISGVYPDSSDLEELWKHIENCDDLVKEVPAERWDWHEIYDEKLSDIHKTNSKWGAFINTVDEFDAEFFKISPLEAQLMDPQHRLFLQTAWKAIEDSGYKVSEISGTSMGVFAGVSYKDYLSLLSDEEAVRAQATTGNDHVMLVNRVSYLLNVSGPSEAIETACSSSLVAVNRAVRSIQAGECDMALAGGVNLMLSSESTVKLANMGMLAPDGKCKTFDCSANGFVKGEGIGLILLKPYEKAMQDKDFIYGVIKGVSTNHDGRSSSITAPNGQAQTNLLVQAYKEAEIEIGTVTYMETHGTGTKLGDPTEVEALKKAFRTLEELQKVKIGQKQYCGLGAIKQNIGHLEAASGITGLIKVLLAMKHKKLPGLPHFKKLNPNILLENSPFYLIEKTMEWKKIYDVNGVPIPRRAGVSSFGYGGTNAHVILEEHRQDIRKYVSLAQNQLFVLSARTKNVLQNYVKNVLEYLEKYSSFASNDVDSVCEEIKGILADILHVTEQYMDAHVNLIEYGMDRIALNELKHRIEKQYQIELPINASLGNVTIHSLAVGISQNSKNNITKEESLQYFYRIAYTSLACRNEMEERLAIVAYDIPDLKRKLNHFLLEKELKQDIYYGKADSRCEHIISLLGTSAEAFQSVAQKWVLGGVFDLSSLYSNGVPDKITFPTYPFDNQKYWCQGKQGKFDEVNAMNCTNTKDTLRFLCKKYKKSDKVYCHENVLPKTILLFVNENTEPMVKEIKKRYEDTSVICIQNKPVYNRNREHIHLPFHDYKEGQRISRQLFSKNSSIRTIIDLSDLYEDEQPELFQENGAKVAIIQEFIRQFKNEKIGVFHFTKGLQSFGGTKADLSGSTVAGLIRMLGAEYRKLSASTIDIDFQWFENLQYFIDILIREINNVEKSGEICYRNFLRYIPYLDDVEKSDIRKERKPDKDKVIVITGGTRGIGSQLAIHYVRKGFKKIVLMGKEEVPIEGKDNTLLGNLELSPSMKKKIQLVKDLESQGASVMVYGGSLTNRNRINKFFHDVRVKLGNIGTVLYCAGSVQNENPAFISKDWSEIKATYEPKISGLIVVSQVLSQDCLDAFVLFSSISGMVPKLGVGGSIYAAANAFMDYFASYMFYSGKFYYRSVNWTNWLDGGMGIVTSKVNSELGFDGMTFETGLQQLEKVFDINVPVILPCIHSKNLEPTHLLEQKSEKMMESQLEQKDQKKAIHFMNVDTTELVKNLLSEELRIPEDKLDEDISFSDFGVDSIILAQLVKALEKKVNANIEPSIFLECPTIKMLSSELAIRGYSVACEEERKIQESKEVNLDIKKQLLSSKSQQFNTEMDNKIAVIGAGCIFAESDGLEKYWENLKNGRDLICEIPKSRWDADKLYSPVLTDGKSISKWGSFLKDIEYFDPGYYKIPKEDTVCIDPLIRKFLEVMTQAICNAGYTKDDLWNKRAGLFVGSRISNYTEKIIDKVRKNGATGVGQNFIAAYAAQIFNLKGPNVVVDSACSSSLVSIHLACQSLLSNETEMAIAGGVDILLDERPYLLLSKSGALSPDGRCYTFDARANGFVPGEGAGAVILKKLNKAIADGDMIYGVIDSTSVNNDGATMGVTTPNPEAQAAVVEEAILKAGINLETISYLEAHGTGTLIGDPIELKALTKVFQKHTDKIGYCGVGSVKSNMGHLLSAAGISGFIKILLCLQNKQLVPTLHCENPNPRFQFDTSPFYPVQKLTEWNKEQGVRRAGISAFGFGGTNAHVLVSEWEDTKNQYVRRKWPLPQPEYKKERYWFNHENQEYNTKKLEENPVKQLRLRKNQMKRGKHYEGE
ncbi:UNVERIFIED_CONTAM: phosphopantetheine binding protein [Acetivibrio alkalicellulosi]